MATWSAHFDPNPWISDRALLWIARAGYGGRGAVFLLLGAFAGLSALGFGWQPVGTTEALRSLLMSPAGLLAVPILGAGLLCFALFRATEAVLDVHNYGRDMGGILRRTGLAASGLFYGGLTVITASVILGWNLQQGDGDQSVRHWTAWLMSFPAGGWLVGVAGSIVIAIGIGLGVAGIRESFRRRVRFKGHEKSVVALLGKIGFLARSVVMLLIGGFLVFAALTSNPQHAEGLAGALLILKQQTYGGVLLGVTAAGLLCFGAFGLSEAFMAEINKHRC